MGQEEVAAAAAAGVGASPARTVTPPPTSLAPGFRFHPTDEELVRYYLRRKACGKPFRFQAFTEMDVYKSEPCELAGVAGDGFMASGLTIQNTAGLGAHQAVAFRLDSDLSFIENCEFLANQDKLYSHSLRQYYKSGRIQGNVDFIFGNSAAFFQDYLILVATRQIKPEKGENNAVTAHGRIDPAQFTVSSSKIM